MYTGKNLADLKKQRTCERSSRSAEFFVRRNNRHNSVDVTILPRTHGSSYIPNEHLQVGRAQRILLCDQSRDHEVFIQQRGRPRTERRKRENRGFFNHESSLSGLHPIRAHSGSRGRALFVYFTAFVVQSWPRRQKSRCCIFSVKNTCIPQACL